MEQPLFGKLHEFLIFREGSCLDLKCVITFFFFFLDSKDRNIIVSKSIEVQD